MCLAYFSDVAMYAACGPPNPIGTPKRCILPTQMSAPKVPGAGNSVRARGSAATTDRAPAAWALDDTPAASPTTSPRVFGYCQSTPMHASPNSSDVASPTCTSMPNASHRVLTTAIVWG